MITEQLAYSFGWASWSSVFAGGVTVCSLSILMSVLGLALGLAILDPKSDDPLAGQGVAFGVWSFISVVVCMAGGGLIAGLFAGQKGLEHGFLVWAIVTMLGTYFSTTAVGTAVRMVGSTLRGIGSGTASAVAAMGKGTADVVSGAVSELREAVNLNLDTSSLGDDVLGTLRDTGVGTLQPEHLESQMREARSDLRNTLHQLSLHPKSADQILSSFLGSLQGRLESLTKDIDKETAVELLMKKRNIPKEEAETIVQNAITAYEQVVQKARDTLAEAKTQFEDAKKQMKDLMEYAREKADELASTASKAALLAGIALIVAALISMCAGLYGATHATQWQVFQTTYVS